MNRGKRLLAVWLLVCSMLLSGCAGDSKEAPAKKDTESGKTASYEENVSGSEDGETVPVAEDLSFDIGDVPAYSGDPYVSVNNNVPFFTEDELTTDSFEAYSELDGLERCGTAYASIGEDLMPTEKRSSIGKVKPSGWHSVEYEIVEGKSLYNRCHLIGYQLTAENANEKNLITGTRYLNTEGMLPFENMVADYVKETKNHVLYRVTPLFEGDNLVASGVQMEGMSVEDAGEEILFNVYCYNVQPGISIDYATGESCLEGGEIQDEVPPETVKEKDIGSEERETGETEYILNTNTKKFHKPSCSSVKQMKGSNTEEFSGSREEVIAKGYDPCGRCKP